jgi:hypothetical protein
MGISKKGQFANKRFCDITGFQQPKNGNDPRGDAFLGNVWVEIKAGTYNQVRPYHYSVLVGYDNELDEWYVIPPHDVLSMTKNKRGQHTTNPMECMNGGKVKSKKYQSYKVSVSDLKSKVIEAYQEGESRPFMKALANRKKAEFEMAPKINTEEVEEAERQERENVAQ